METHFTVMGQNNEHSEVDKILIYRFKIRCKPIYRLNAIRIRNPAGFFVQMDHLIQMYVNIQGTRLSGTILGMKDILGGLTLHYFKTRRSYSSADVWCRLSADVEMNGWL